MRNVLLDLTTIVPATAYHRRSYAERYSRFSASADDVCETRYVPHAGSFFVR